MNDFANRREFLQVAGGGAVASFAARATIAEAAEEDGEGQGERESLAGVVGITTGGLTHQRTTRKLTVFTLPEFVHGELGMRMIDLNTRWLKSFDEGYVSRVRENAEQWQCFFSNLKVNHKFGDLYSTDADERARAKGNARQLIRAANVLGARWIRFVVPRIASENEGSKLVAYRELASFAEGHGIQLLVENLGWLQSDPHSIVRVVKAIGRNVAACPDTGNWKAGVRYDALARSFPGAASCDFKVFDLNADRHHKKYNIRRCFEVAWHAGFRGPWAIEHWNEDSKAYVRETSFLRDELTQWMAASK